jgi:hypothetical protein
MKKVPLESDWCARSITNLLPAALRGGRGHAAHGLLYETEPAHLPRRQVRSGYAAVVTRDRG